MKKHLITAISIFLSLVMSISILVFAESDSKVMATQTLDESVKIYVRNAEISDEIKFQVGNIPAEEIKVYSITDDEAPMRTLILLDNSLSVSKNSRQQVIETLNAIVDAHADKEQFRIATFSETFNPLSDLYTNDYTLLHTLIGGIKFEDQCSKLTDVLYEVISDINAENYGGYTRIIVFSDGVNDKETGGRTFGEVKELLKDTPYPIYTFGFSTGTGKNSNDDLLDTLFELSRYRDGLTRHRDCDCESGVFEKMNAAQIVAITSLDNTLVICEAVIPADARVGGRISSKLTLADGHEFELETDIPFSIKEAEPEPEQEPVIEPEKKNETPSVPIVVSEPIPEESVKKSVPIWLWVVIGIAILAAVGGTVYFGFLRVKRNKNATGNTEGYSQTVSPGQYPRYEKTVFISEEKTTHRDTVQLTPEEAQTVSKKYRVSLTDSNDELRSFRCELTDTISIGRRPENNIVISDDNSVHGNHCRISVKGGVFYITDIKDVKNHTSVNGLAIKPEIPQLIVTNTTITLGRHSYVVNISEV